MNMMLLQATAGEKDDGVGGRGRVKCCIWRGSRLIHAQYRMEQSEDNLNGNCGISF